MISWSRREHTCSWIKLSRYVLAINKTVIWSLRLRACFQWKTRWIKIPVWGSKRKRKEEQKKAVQPWEMWAKRRAKNEKRRRSYDKMQIDWLRSGWTQKYLALGRRERTLSQILTLQPLHPVIKSVMIYPSYKVGMSYDYKTSYLSNHFFLYSGACNPKGSGDVISQQCHSTVSAGGFLVSLIRLHSKSSSLNSTDTAITEWYNDHWTVRSSNLHDSLHYPTINSILIRKNNFIHSCLICRDFCVWCWYRIFCQAAWSSHEAVVLWRF